MGSNFGANIAAWTFFVIVFKSVTTAFDHSLLLDLGLNILPDRAKINISLEEYTSVISKFLHSREDTFETIPELKIYKLDKPRHQSQNRALKMVFPVPASNEEIESASLRLFLPPQHNDSSIIKVQVNEILGARRRRFLHESVLYLSENFSKWCDMDVTSAVSSWTNGHKNLGLELVCVSCNNHLNPHEAAITALVHNPQTRAKRSVHGSERRRTDCKNNHPKGKKRKCCRHEMKVSFTKLPFPEMEYIVEPRVYEAGYCHGLCPPNFNLATNHSRIQGLMHQIHKNEARLDNKKNSVPRTCCAPSKLGDLEILLVNRHDPSKLVVEKWEKMRVIECGCS